MSDAPIAAESAAPVAPFTRLHPSVRYLIAEVLRFSGLRPVQAMTIDPILEGRDLIVIAPTAGGKTEAAFRDSVRRRPADFGPPAPSTDP